MGYIVWWIKLMAKGTNPFTAYRFIRTMKISRTGFGFVDRRNPTIKRIKKSWMYLKFVLNGINPMFAVRMVNVSFTSQFAFDRRRN